jgi:hypothetical protein
MQATSVYFNMEAITAVLHSVPRDEVEALLGRGLLGDRKTCTLTAEVLSVALSTLQVSGQPCGWLPRLDDVLLTPPSLLPYSACRHPR